MKKPQAAQDGSFKFDNGIADLTGLKNKMGDSKRVFA